MRGGLMTDMGDSFHSLKKVTSVLPLLYFHRGCGFSAWRCIDHLAIGRERPF